MEPDPGVTVEDMGVRTQWASRVAPSNEAAGGRETVLLKTRLVFSAPLHGCSRGGVQSQVWCEGKRFTKLPTWRRATTVAGVNPGPSVFLVPTRLSHFMVRPRWSHSMDAVAWAAR